MSAVYFDQRAFADRVMARVANEPTPTAAGAVRRAMLGLRLGEVIGAAWTAWHLATTRTVVRPRVRFSSALLLAALLVIAAMGTALAAAGAAVVVDQVAQVAQHFHD